MNYQRCYPRKSTICHTSNITLGINKSRRDSSKVAILDQESHPRKYIHLEITDLIIVLAGTMYRSQNAFVMKDE